MADFLIVHGAWTCGWSWQRVVDALHARGHRAFVPTLTGLGERSHLSDGVTLDTHVADVVNQARFKDVEGFTLVAHSYGGIVATAAAEQLEARIGSAVLVEAFLPGHGQSFASMAPGLELDGPLVPVPPGGAEDYLRREDFEWAMAKATPQPTGTFTQPVATTGALDRIARKCFVVATGWDAFRATADGLRGKPGWMVRELPCGHDVPVDMPVELAEIMIETGS